MKDEALSPIAYVVNDCHIASSEPAFVGGPNEASIPIISLVGDDQSFDDTSAIHDWLHHEFGIDKPGRALAEPHKLDPDGFVTAVRAALPKSRKWSAAEIARLKQEHADTLTPARNAAADILALERRLSDLVNVAYGLTPEDVALMWRTAPPRMPLNPADELRRLTASRGEPSR